MVIVPTERGEGVEAWVQRTTLEGRDYLLSFTWSRREERWSLDIAAEDAVPIVQGIKLCAGAAVAVRVTDPRCFPGEILVVDTASVADGVSDPQLAIDPGLDDLGERVVLVYLTAAEAAAA